MASVFDVAAYILKRQSPMTTWKLQKLVYYCRAWSLVWDDDVLFPARRSKHGPTGRWFVNSTTPIRASIAFHVCAREARKR